MMRATGAERSVYVPMMRASTRAKSAHIRIWNSGGYARLSSSWADMSE